MPAFTATRPPSAVEAFDVIRPHVEALDPLARLYLVLGEDVMAGGVATHWRFLLLLPTQRREVEATAAAEAAGTIYNVTFGLEVNQFPRPGSPEWALASMGSNGAAMLEENWRDRVEKLPGLPVPFIDSSHAISVLNDRGANAFVGGEARLKGRMLPAGDAVWEIANSFGEFHVPFDAALWTTS